MGVHAFASVVKALVVQRGVISVCQANDKLTYLNERQIDLPVDVRFLRFFGSQRGVQRADGCELP